MRIKQQTLKGHRPDAEYVRSVSGQRALVQVFSKPALCVNVVTRQAKHCYPVTQRTYNNYMSGQL